MHHHSKHASQQSVDAVKPWSEAGISVNPQSIGITQPLSSSIKKSNKVVVTSKKHKNGVTA